MSGVRLRFCLCVNWFSFLHTKIPRFLCSPVGFLTLGSPNLYPNHPPRLTAHTRHGHTYLQDAQSGGSAHAPQSPCPCAQGSHTYNRKFTVTFTEKSVALLLLHRSLAVSLTGCWLRRATRRTARRGIPSDGSASCCVVPWYDAANFLGLNTFGTPGHTCFTLPEQPPCAPCFARTHSNSISLWTCILSDIPISPGKRQRQHAVPFFCTHNIAHGH